MEELRQFIAPMDGPHRRSAILRISDCTGVHRRTVVRWLDKDVGISDVFKRLINEEFNRQIFVL